MRSPAAAIDISSDDEDDVRTPGGAGERGSTVGGWPTTPGAGKHPHPPDGGRWRTPGVGKDDGGLEWAEKLLDDEDCYAIEEGLADSAEMQELWASLVDETDVLVHVKKHLVGEPEKKKKKKNLLDAADDDDDDDCVILDVDPEKTAVMVAKEEGPPQDPVEDELQIVAEKGELACRDFPHPRHLCVSSSFSTSSHASHCNMCHCYVCDSPAPCAYWGKGAGIDDHCHATDKDPKWKTLRQLFKHKSQQAPKLGGVQNFLQSSSTSANLMIPSEGRFPVSSSASQTKQMHPSNMVSQNMEQSIFWSRGPSRRQRTTIPCNRSKRARVAAPVSTPSNVNYTTQHSVTSYCPTEPTFLCQTAQVPQGDTYWSSPYLPPPNGSQVYQRQRQALPHPVVHPHTVVGTGVPLSRCTSLSTQGGQQPQGPSAETSITLKDALTNLANELGVPDYNIDPPVGQQSASSPSQALYTNQVLGAKTSQRGKTNPSYVASQAPLRIRPFSRHNPSKHTSGSTVVSSDAIQTNKQPLCQLNSQSSLIPNQTTPSAAVVISQPWNVDGT